MVTGDNKVTATAIARECNILTTEMNHLTNTNEKNDYIMEGPEFYQRMGGLLCKNDGCNKDPKDCLCGPKKINEGVKNLNAFK